MHSCGSHTVAEQHIKMATLVVSEYIEFQAYNQCPFCIADSFCPSHQPILLRFAPVVVAYFPRLTRFNTINNC